VNLCGIGFLPIYAIRAGAELFVFSKFTSIGIKGIAMKGSMTHGITRWVLGGMQGVEAGGSSKVSIGCGSEGVG